MKNGSLEVTPGASILWRLPEGLSKTAPSAVSGMQGGFLY